MRYEARDYTKNQALKPFFCVSRQFRGENSDGQALLEIQIFGMKC